MSKIPHQHFKTPIYIDFTNQLSTYSGSEYETCDADDMRQDIVELVANTQSSSMLVLWVPRVVEQAITLGAWPHRPLVKIKLIISRARTINIFNYWAIFF
jgi:hypothetical protein